MMFLITGRQRHLPDETPTGASRLASRTNLDIPTIFHRSRLRLHEIVR